MTWRILTTAAAFAAGWLFLLSAMDNSATTGLHLLLALAAALAFAVAWVAATRG